MKAKNGLLLFIISLVLVSCFNAPEFSNTPSIKLEDFYFGKSKRLDKPDSLVINVSFEDGDGDLGLDNSFLSDPFHNYNYFIALDNGTLLPVTKTELVPDYYELNIPPGTTGKIAVNKTRKTAPFDQLMVPFGPTTSCTNYSRLDPETHLDSVLIKASWRDLIDETYTYLEVTYKDPKDYILVRDTFYVEANPNFYNIEVHLLRKVDVGQYEEFDFTPYCPLSFNGRFPILTDLDKENPLSGDIQYSMTSSAIENIMGNSIWKLRILIRDRGLNTSKAAESKDFTLEEIKR
jgi:hypothetical protein